MQDGSRGLEGYSSRLHAMRRQRHFQDTKHAVFLEQARQTLSQNKDDTMLAKQAEQASRRARSFAFLLGQAGTFYWRLWIQNGGIVARCISFCFGFEDAWAVKAEDDTKNEQEEKTCTPSSSEEFANENEQNWEKQKSDTPTQPVERKSSWQIGWTKMLGTICVHVLVPWYWMDLRYNATIVCLIFSWNQSTVVWLSVLFFSWSRSMHIAAMLGLILKILSLIVRQS